MKNEQQRRQASCRLAGVENLANDEHVRNVSESESKKKTQVATTKLFKALK